MRITITHIADKTADMYSLLYRNEIILGLRNPK